ncbi:hypothetical protein K440DRAFT_249257 [Wilcoxina mikolae CBS 423.85]|nr:hypothetical protein K440DRAFT_249257 [Wilcoxina mikolae CBS 423.85]
MIFLWWSSCVVQLFPILASRSFQFIVHFVRFHRFHCVGWFVFQTSVFCYVGVGKRAGRVYPESWWKDRLL